MQSGRRTGEGAGPPALPQPDAATTQPEDRVLPASPTAGGATPWLWRALGWFATDRWPLYATLGAVLVVAAFFPVLVLRSGLDPGTAIAPVPPLAGEAGAIELAWSYDLARAPFIINRASALPQNPTLFHPWWWALGWLWRILGNLPPDIAWAGFASVLAALLLLALRFLLRVVLPDGRARALALALIVLSGGWRWVHFGGTALGVLGRPIYYSQFWNAPADALQHSTAFGGPLVDSWIAPERLGVVAAQATMLAFVARALLATSLRAALLSWLGAGLALAALQPLSPGSFRMAAIAGTLTVVITSVMSGQPLAQRLRHVAGLAVLLGLAWPVHRWYLALPATEPAWAYVWSRNEALLVHPGHLLLALGSVAAGGLAWTVGQAAGARTSIARPVMVLFFSWALAALWLPSLTWITGGIRPLDVAVLASLPLAVLAADLLAVGLRGVLSSHAMPVVVALALIANLPSIGFYGVAAAREVVTRRTVLTPADAAIIADLHQRGRAGAVTLTNDEHLDRLVLAMTNKRTAGGWLTELRGHAKGLRHEFFIEPASRQRQAELLEALGVGYVLYGRGNGQPPQPSLLLRLVAAGPQLTLWEVQLPPQPWSDVQAGDLVRGPSGTIYLFDGRHRRWVPDLATFSARGYRWEQVRALSGWQLATIPEGYPLPRADAGS